MHWWAVSWIIAIYCYPAILVQTALCRVVCRLPWKAHVCYCMKSLHWLPLKFRIDLNTCVIISKISLNDSTKYLSKLVVPYTCAVSTRRSNPKFKILQTIPYNRNILTYFSQLRGSFAYSGPRLWNDLPLHIRQSETVFKKSLKLHLFTWHTLHD